MTVSLPPILFATRHILVIEKPAGIAVHPGPRTPHSLEAILPAYQHGRPPPHAVHRLDRDTSGCLMLGRTPSAVHQLGRMFSDGQVQKTYWAIVTGLSDAADAGMIDFPLAKRSSREKGWRMVRADDGKPARTAWRVLARRDGLALVAFHPQTGRTHQIRVHATALAPTAAILGDPIYGRAHPLGMMLHARALGFTDPWTKMPETVEAPCPDRFLKLGLDG